MTFEICWEEEKRLGSNNRENDLLNNGLKVSRMCGCIMRIFRNDGFVYNTRMVVRVVG